MEANIQEMLEQAVSLHKANQLDKAETVYKQVLALEDSQHDALHLLGLIEHKKGHYPQAIELIKKAIELVPENAVFHLNLGLAFKEQGLSTEAEAQYRKAIELEASHVNAHFYLGNLLRRNNKIVEALASYQKVVQLDDAKDNVWHLIALCHKELRQYEMAVKAIEKAIVLKPDSVGYRMFLAKIQLDTQDFKAAKKVLGHALQIEPNNADVVEQYAIACHKLGDEKEAQESFNKALELSPGNSQYHNNLGVCYFESGDLTQAETQFKKAIDLNPKFAQAHYNYSQVTSFDWDSPERFILENFVQSSNLTDAERIEYHFALAKIYEDCGKYPEAFEQLSKGNQLKNFPYDKTVHNQFLTNIAEVFTPELIEEKAQFGSSATTPIFIVGMPRSGTTLVEQIIGSHSKACARGELIAMSTITQSLVNKHDQDEMYPGIIKKVTKSIIQEMYEYYLDVMVGDKEGLSAYTDKMPTNFYHLGLISIMFPYAKVIHCRRNPLDTILSIYSQNFRFPQKCGSSLDSITDYYQGYLRIMEHWRNTLTTPFYEVDYEQLVNEPKAEIKQLIDFCELPWESSCLNSHKAKTHVRTASIWQVRQPIYNKSVDKWKKYQEELVLVKEMFPPTSD